MLLCSFLAGSRLSAPISCLSPESNAVQRSRSQTPGFQSSSSILECHRRIGTRIILRCKRGLSGTWNPGRAHWPAVASSLQPRSPCQDLKKGFWRFVRIALQMNSSHAGRCTRGLCMDCAGNHQIHQPGHPLHSRISRKCGALGFLRTTADRPSHGRPRPTDSRFLGCVGLHSLRTKKPETGALLHRLVRDTFKWSPRGLAVRVSVRKVYFRAYGVLGRHAGWKADLPPDADALYNASRMALMARCVWFGINALDERPNSFSALYEECLRGKSRDGGRRAIFEVSASPAIGHASSCRVCEIVDVSHSAFCRECLFPLFDPQLGARSPSSL